MKTLMTVTLIAGLLGAAFAQTMSPKETEKLIQDKMDAKAAEIKKSGDQSDWPKDIAKITAEVEEKLKGIDFDRVSPQEAYDWIRVFDSLGDEKMVYKVAKIAAGGILEQPKRFDAQVAMVGSLSQLGEVAPLKDVWFSTHAVGDSEIETMIVEAPFVADAVCAKEGPAAGIAMLDSFQQQYPKPLDVNVLAQDLEPMVASQDPKKSKADIEKQAFDNAREKYDWSNLRLVGEKAKLLEQEGEKAKAITLIKNFSNDIPTQKKGLKEQANQLLLHCSMLGSTAPGITALSSLQGFKSLDDLKGKVVLLDFFAHWCEPCMESMPNLVSLYSKLHSQGFEIVGVTSYYGFFNSQKNLSKPDELAKLSGLMKKAGIIWPVAVGPRSDYDSYGITGIPTSVLIGKDGTVLNSWTGFTPATEQAINEAVEKALQE